MNLFFGEYYLPTMTKPSRINVKAPIEWITIEEDGDKTLLLSRFVLDWEMYDFGDKQCTWIDSYLKTILNEFYEQSFSDEEKQAIIEIKEERVFVLSKEEVLKYMPDKKSRMTSMVSISELDGNIEIEHYSYWLRKDMYMDKIEEYEIAPCVNAVGDIYYEDVSSDEIGVRLAIYVNTNQAKMISAKKGYNPFHPWNINDYI